MRWKLVLGSILAMITLGAAAAELPIEAAYGTPNGCAVHAGGAGEPGGENTVFAKERMRFAGSVCNYTGVSETAEGGWDVGIRCASGHEDELPGKLTVTEVDGALDVALVDGEGPEGEFPVCEAE